MMQRNTATIVILVLTFLLQPVLAKPESGSSSGLPVDTQTDVPASATNRVFLRIFGQDFAPGKSKLKLEKSNREGSYAVILSGAKGEITRGTFKEEFRLPNIIPENRVLQNPNVVQFRVDEVVGSIDGAFGSGTIRGRQTSVTYLIDGVEITLEAFNIIEEGLELEELIENALRTKRASAKGTSASNLESSFLNTTATNVNREFSLVRTANFGFLNTQESSCYQCNLQFEIDITTCWQSSAACQVQAVAITGLVLTGCLATGIGIPACITAADLIFLGLIEDCITTETNCYQVAIGTRTYCLAFCDDGAGGDPL